MTPPPQDGTCDPCGPEDTSQRFWSRILARTLVFGCLLTLAAVIFGAIYLVVWLYRRPSP